MANYTVVNDLKTDILRRANELTNGTSDFDSRITDYINRALMEMLQLGIPFPWMRQVGKTFNTTAKITTGTVLVTNGSTAITFSSAPASSVQGRKFQVDQKGAIYRIASHTGGAAAATLDGAYVDANNAAANYVVFQDEYSLDANLLLLATPLRVYEWPWRIDVIDERSLEDEYPASKVIEGVPMKASLIGEQRIRLSHYPGTDIKRLEYDMLEIPSDLAAGGTPTMPRPDRKALASGGSFYLLVDKEDSRAEAARQEFNRELELMEARYYRQKIGSSQSFAQFLTRQDQAAGRYASGPLRTQSGLIIG